MSPSKKEQYRVIKAEEPAYLMKEELQWSS